MVEFVKTRMGLLSVVVNNVFMEGDAKLTNVGSVVLLLCAGVVVYANVRMDTLEMDIFVNVIQMELRNTVVVAVSTPYVAVLGSASVRLVIWGMEDFANPNLKKLYTVAVTQILVSMKDPA